MMLRSTPLLALACWSQVNAAPLEASNPTVTIDNGIVIGTATGVFNQPAVTGSVHAYLGVPFAKPPTGDLRFAPPEAPSSWTTPLLAQTLPPACLQKFPSGNAGAKTRAYFNNPGYAEPPESEDCLYLNVFAPPDASPINPKPVMFWLFGGNNDFGTASLAFYNGSSLAVNEGVVVVAINYRTNIFGFSNSPEIPFGKQNSGYLDQRLALQWVQDNIGAFGGDPSQVTLFGESAGGHDIKQLLANPPSPLPFRAAILQSPNQAGTTTSLASYTLVLAHFGCAAAPSPLACIRRVPATDLQAYVSSTGLGFSEVVGDGTSVGKQSLPSLASGTFARVPVMIGSNANEFTVFLDVAGLNANPWAFLNATLAQRGIPPSIINSSLISRFYASTADDEPSLVAQILTDLFFTCTTHTLSTALSASGLQVHRYRYEGHFPNLTPFPNAGAWHSSEIPLVWGTYPTTNADGTVTVTDDERALSSAMQRAWAGFARDPAAGPGWPRVGSAGGRELGVFGGPERPRGEVTRALLSSDASCVVFAPLLIAAGAAY